MTYSILVVEDQAITSAGVRFVLERDGQYQVTAEAGSLAAARSLVESSPPDIVILDLVLPDGLGLDLLREIRARDENEPKVLLYSGQAIPQEFATAAELGANALLSKADSPEELLAALGHIVKGQQFISDSVKGKLAIGDREKLTKREQQILQLLSQGMTNQEIATEFSIATATIRKHRENILNKLGVSNTTAAVSMGIRKRIIDDSDR